MENLFPRKFKFTPLTSKTLFLKLLIIVEKNLKT